MGLSHVVSVQSAGRCVTEVTADDIEVLPQNGMVTSFQFRGERDHAMEIPMLRADGTVFLADVSARGQTS